MKTMQDSDPPGLLHESSNALAGKTILLVNIGSPKKAFILHRMKELGLQIVALHPTTETWASPLVDHWIHVEKGEDQKNIFARIQDFCNKHLTIKIEGGVTFWEEDVPLLAGICREFGWIGNSLETAELTRSKFAMQEKFAEKGLHAIRQQLIHEEIDLERAMESVGFPAILKPLYGTDSLCVIYAQTKEEARLRYPFVRAQYQGPYEVLHTYNDLSFVYQEYIAGPEFSVECYAQNGIPHVVAVHQKTNMQLPFFMETGEITPPQIAEDLEISLRSEAEACLRALDIHDSLAHVEIKLSPRGPQVIEVGSRMGGDNIYSQAKESFGIDLVRIACSIALGISVTDKPLLKPKHAMNFYIIPQESCRITRMDGISALEQHPHVVDFHISKTVNDVTLVPPLGFESIGWILIKGDSYEDLQDTMKNILGSFRISTEPLQQAVPTQSALKLQEQVMVRQ